MSRLRTRWLFVAGVSLVAIVVALPAPLWYGRLHPARVPVDDDPDRHGLAYQPIAFASLADGRMLSGWYLPAPLPAGRAIVIVPGIDDNRLQSGITLRLAPALLGAGFDVLAFDLRGEGDSGPGPVTFGALEQWDVLAAVATAQDRGATSVGVLGFSLGAGSAILAAARSPDIGALAVDSAFYDLEETLTRELEARYGLPRALAPYGLAWFGPLAGVSLDEISPGHVIGTIPPRPVLLIHGEQDATIPPSDSERLRLAADLPADRLWIVPGGTHARGYFADPLGYEQRVVAFFSESLPWATRARSAERPTPGSP